MQRRGDGKGIQNLNLNQFRNSMKEEASTVTTSNACAAAAVPVPVPVPSIQKYEVLYYKRTNKVHKTKGTSRLDGILTVHFPPSNLVTLQPTPAHDDDDDDDSSSTEEDEEDDDDDGNGKKMTYKQRMKSMRKKKNKKGGRSGKRKESQRQQMIYSKKNVDIVKRVIEKGSLEEDDIIVLPSWECQIVSNVSSSQSKSSKLPNFGVKFGGTGPLLSKSKGQSVKQAGAGSLSGSGFLGKKRSLVNRSNSSSAVGGINININTKSIRNPLLKSKTPLQSLRVQSNRNRNRNRIQPSTTKRNPPPQPKCKSKEAAEYYSNDGNGNDSDDQIDNIDQHQKIVPSTFTSSKFNTNSSLFKKRKLVCGTLQQQTQTTSLKASKPNLNSGQKLNVNVNVSVSVNDECFKGAIGTINAPAAIKAILREHQKKGIVFLWNCITGACPKLKQLKQDRDIDNDHNGAVLADEMGLGKTLMTITIIFALHRKNRNDRFIVVCPSSLVNNWAKEFDKFVGKASQPKRIIIQGGKEGLQKLKSFIPVKPQKSEVLIISYDLFRRNSAILSEATNIGLLVVDEGHRLKNTAGTKVLTALNSLKCSARVLISGTPIQNNLSEFYNVVNFVLPNVLGHLNEFRRVYERPITVANKKNASTDQKENGAFVSNELNRITSIFMIRRLQKVVLKTLLPPRFETLLFCRPSVVQCTMYAELTKHVTDQLTTLTNLRKLCSHPDLLKKTVDTIEGVDDNATACSKAGKLDILEALLSSIRTESPSDKVVVVSNFTSALTIVDNYILKRKGWASVRLDGTTEQSSRQTIVDSFNRSSTDQSFVFLLSSKAGGCGLNLIGANRLVMLDLDWNPAIDAQAMARIYRQGQKKECFVYRLLTSGTVEEVMFQRQTQKNNLDTGPGNNFCNQSTRFTDEELKDCFTLKDACRCDTKDKIGASWDEYYGVRTLEDKEVTDAPLLKLARIKSDVLTYVHLVKATEVSPVNLSTQEDPISEEEESWDCFDEDSDEEAEFEE